MGRPTVESDSLVLETLFEVYGARGIFPKENTERGGFVRLG
jgi:hypothetical protein